MFIICQVCQHANSAEYRTCAVCGEPLRRKGSAAGNTLPMIKPQEHVTDWEPQENQGFASWLRSLFEEVELEGTIDHVDPLYMVYTHSGGLERLATSLATLAVVMFFLYLLLPIIAAFFFLAALLGSLGCGGRGRGPGRMVFSFMPFIWPRRFPRSKEVPVRDIRLKVTQNDQMIRLYFVRVRGELAWGSISRGDKVKVVGPMRNGTLMLRHGHNYTTGSVIKVKCR
jgi:hypothetical protein